MKSYKAIYFDWDGTAVLSRKAPVTEVVVPMKLLLGQGVKLIIVSGTTYENIAAGKLHTYFTPDELKHLYLGLGRGAYNYRFDSSGTPFLWKSCLPDSKSLLLIHDICYEIHRTLLKDYDIATDIIFSRPNYCKIDLMVHASRGDQLFLQDNEVQFLNHFLEEHHYEGKLSGLIALAEDTAQKNGMSLSATSDAKYLEVGLSSKSDNVNMIFSHLNGDFNIQAEDCTFWGDEYIGLDEGIFGSDSFMITPLTENGDFYDVSDLPGLRPAQVKKVGGGVRQFMDFLYKNAHADYIVNK